MKSTGKNAGRQSVWKRLFSKKPAVVKGNIQFNENHPALTRKKEEAQRLLEIEKLQAQ